MNCAAAQKWARLAPFPEASEELYGIASGGKLHVFGGLGPGWTPKGLTYEYDAGADRWTKKKPMALVSHHLALAELNGKIYVIGGRIGAAFITRAGNTDIVEVYDPATNRWTILPPMEFARHGLAGNSVGNRLHLVSGNAQSGGSPGAVVESDAHEVLELP